jgi:hypothetical protein
MPMLPQDDEPPAPPWLAPPEAEPPAAEPPAPAWFAPPPPWLAPPAAPEPPLPLVLVLLAFVAVVLPLDAGEVVPPSSSVLDDAHA